MDAIWYQNEESNAELFNGLRDDPKAKELHALTLKDWELGRLTEPVPAEQADTKNVQFAMLALACVIASSHSAGSLRAAFWGSPGCEGGRRRESSAG